MSPGTFRSHAPGLYNRPKSLASINGWIVNSMPLSANGATNCARRYRVAAASVGYDAKARTFIGVTPMTTVRRAARQTSLLTRQNVFVQAAIALHSDRPHIKQAFSYFSS